MFTASRIAIILALSASSACYIVDPGPVVKATKGEVWPKPQQQESKNTYLSVEPLNFNFRSVGNECNTLLGALNRYWKIISNGGNLERRGRLPETLKSFKKGRQTFADDNNYQGVLNVLNINLTEPCKDQEYPTIDMKEEYQLIVATTQSLLMSDSLWGILRGLETFSQLVHLGNDMTTLVVNETQIRDFPRFKHRSILLDTSRHFIPLYSIYQLLDGMAYNKFNVFHWHIVDDHSFPYQSKRFPELSDYGAYHPVSKIYTQLDVAKVLEYARERGIRVIPEFDTPGHTRSWGEGVSDILTACYDSKGNPTGHYGPMDVTNNKTYRFMNELLKEISEVFVDNYIHLGGDEVGFECWESNSNISSFMARENITTYNELESFYIQQIINMVHNLNKSSIVWEEVFENGVQLPNQTVVHVWIVNDFFNETLNNVTKAGKPALLSACWYLDRLETGGDWIKYYQCEPYDFDGTEEQKRLIIGGGACMWAESVNEYNLIPRVFPRASAAAEKLWSDESVNDVDDAARRLEEHTCRMNHRGIAAQPPNGPGVCL